jgi:RNA polymerase sigma factor (sigma-70 family)
MVTRQQESMGREVERLLSDAAPERGDGELLERFALGRDESAFAALVERHGPLVLGVGRRILRDHHAAEDVFQATFLLLARKAGALDRRRALAPWLYTVAYRLALRQRMLLTQRHRREERAARPEALHDPAPPEDLAPLLDDEIGRLPEKYRLPVVLCYLEGKTHEEAARQLDWPTGTVAGRLARARTLLHSRLTRRGFALGAFPLLTPTSPAAELVERTVAGVIGGATFVSSSVQALVNTMLRQLFLVRIQAPLVLLLLLGLTGLGLAFVSGRPDAEKPKPAASSVAHDADGFPLPPGAIARLGSARWREPYPSRLLAFSPDGKLFVSAGDGLTVWDAATGLRLRTVSKEVEQPGALVFAPDSKSLAILQNQGRGKGSARNRVVLLDVHTGKVLQTIEDKENVLGLAYSRDGNHLLTTASGQLNWWDCRSGRKLDSVRVTDQYNALLYRPQLSRDGKTLLTTSETIVRLWEVSTGAVNQPPQLRPLRTLDGAKQRVQIAALAPDGKEFATLSMGGTVRTWDAGTLEQRREFQAEGDDSARDIAYSPDGRSLLVLRDRENSVAGVWDPKAGKLRYALRGSRESKPDSLRPIHVFAFAPDGRTLATAGESDGIRMWDAATGKERPRGDGHASGITALSFSRDGAVIATVSISEENVWLWSARTGRPLRVLRAWGGPYFCTFSPDGKILATGGGNGVVQVWDVATGKELPRFPVQGSCNGAAFTPDGKKLVVAAYGGHCGVWDVASRKELHNFPTTGRQTIWLDTLSGDGRFVVYTGYDGDLWVFDTETGKMRLHDTESGKTRVSGVSGRLPMSDFVFAADGKTLSAVVGNNRLTWDLTAGTLLPLIETPPTPMASVLSPDGHTRAVPAPPELHLVETRTSRGPESERVRARFPVEPNPFHNGQLVFSADGRLLASVEGTTVLVRDLTGGQPGGPLSEVALERCWDDLAHSDAARAWRSVWALALAPGTSESFLRDRVVPTALKPDERRLLTTLIRQLDDDEPAKRDAASAALERAGARAEPVLREALERGPSAEVRVRVEKLLAALVVLVPTGEELRQLRAIEVLEKLGTPEARKLLETLAAGEPRSQRTRAARDALNHLGRP